MKSTLIKIDKSISFDEFCKIDTFEKFKLFELFDINHYKSLSKEYNIEYLQWFFNPVYNEILNRKICRYFEIDFGDDKVLVIIRFTEMPNFRFIRVYNRPLSKNDNSQNVKKVLGVLKSLEFMRFSLLKDNDLNVKDINLDFTDFYFDINYLRNVKFTGKWLRANRVTAFSKSSMFKYFFTNDISEYYDDIFKLREKWAGVLGTKVPIHDTSRFSKVLKRNSKYLTWLLIYLEDTLVAASCFYKIDNYAVVYYEYTLGRDDNIKTKYPESRNIISNITNIILYLECDYLYPFDIERLYIMGVLNADTTGKGLYEYKERMSQGKIEFFNDFEFFNNKEN